MLQYCMSSGLQMQIFIAFRSPHNVTFSVLPHLLPSLPFEQSLADNTASLKVAIVGNKDHSGVSKTRIDLFLRVGPIYCVMLLALLIRRLPVFLRLRGRCCLLVQVHGDRGMALGVELGQVCETNIGDDLALEDDEFLLSKIMCLDMHRSWWKGRRGYRQRRIRPPWAAARPPSRRAVCVPGTLRAYPCSERGWERSRLQMCGREMVRWMWFRARKASW